MKRVLPIVLGLTSLFIALLLASSVTYAYAEETPTITLAEAHEMALANNPQLLNVDESVRQADIMIAGSWSALLPFLTASASETRNDEEIVSEQTVFMPNDSGGFDTNTIEIVQQEEWVEQYGFTAGMTIFNLPSIINLRNAYAGRSQTEYAARQNKNDLLVAVSSAYYQVVSADKLMTVSQENVKNAEEFLRLAQGRLRVGLGTRLDKLQAEQTLLSAKKDLANARDSYRLAKRALAFLIGVEGDFNVHRPEAISAVEGNVDELIEQALAERSDLQAAEMEMDIAARERWATYSNWVPSLDVTYNWTHSSTENIAGENDSWRIVFGATWNIISGGGNLAQARLDASNHRVSANNLLQKKLDIRQEVEQQWITVQQYRRNIELAAKQLELAQETYRLTNRQYEVGQSSSLEVVDASGALSTARVNLVVEQLQLDLALLNLNKAVGVYSTT